MKKVVLWMSALALLAGCAKEKDTNTVAPAGGKTYTITASINNPETRTTAERFQDANTGAYKYAFSWEAGEQISVVPTNVNRSLLFDLQNAETGTFTYTPMGGDEQEYTGFGLAVSPAEALISLEPSVDDYDICFPGSYFYGHSNAILVGTPVSGSNNTQKFQFEHIAALVKVTYKNVPAGTSAMVFEADQNIRGTFHFTSATGISASNDAFTTVDATAPKMAKVEFDEVLDAPLSSVEFFLPIPIGSYQTFQVRLVNAQMETIDGSAQSWTAANPFTLNCADVVACPEVEYPDFSGEWIMVGTADEDYYACPAYSSGNNIKGVEVTINGEAVSSENPTLKMTINKVTSGEYQGMYTIKDANGLYLYAASTGSNYLKGDEVSNPSDMAANHYWSITPDGDGALTIVASKATDYRNVLQMNPNNGTPLFACYSDANSNYSNIKLYSWENAQITQVCATPTISFDGTNVSIETTTPGATIYYTLDGTDPTTSSTVYTAPFALTETKTVKAIAIAEGYQNSGIATKECVFGDVWALVTNASDLSSGDMVVIANFAKGKVAGSIISNGRLASASGVTTFSESGDAIISLTSNAAVFSLGGQEGAWTLTNSEGKVLGATASGKLAYDSGTSTWSVSVAGGGDATIQNGTSNFGRFLFNVNSDWFTTYTSNTNVSMLLPQLYRKPGAPDTRADATLTFSSATAIATLPANDFIAPTLTTDPANLTVTWSSTDQDVAYINANTGAINIKKVGETIIKAKFAGNSDYKPAEASYTLTVNPSYQISFTGVTDNKVNVGSAQNAEVKFKVISSYAWNSSVSFVSGFDNSLTVTPTQSVAGEVEVTVKANVQNTSEDARQLGTITISNGGDTKTVQVWQKGKVGDWANVNSSNITLRNGAYANEATIILGNERVKGMKAGTGSNAGAVALTVPSGSTHLHLHIAGWNNENTKVTISCGNNSVVVINPSELSLTSDTGVSGNSPYTIDGDASSFYYDISLDRITGDKDFTIAATNGKRFVIWGVNAE